MIEIYLTPEEVKDQYLFQGFKPKKVLQIEQHPYYVSELPEDVRQPILDAHRDINIDYEGWWEYVYESFAEKMKNIGIDINLRKHQWKDQKGNDKVSYSPSIYFSGFCSQGDGACFEFRTEDREKLIDYLIGEGLLPVRVKLWKLYNNAAWENMVDSFDVSSSHLGHYYHSGCMTVTVTVERGEDVDDFTYKEWEEITDAIKDHFRGLADDLYKELEKEHDYLTEDEAVIEALDANEFQFDSLGREW